MAVTKRGKRGSKAAPLVAGSALVAAALWAGASRVGDSDGAARNAGQMQPDQAAVESWEEPATVVDPLAFADDASPSAQQEQPIARMQSGATGFAPERTPAYPPAPAPAPAMAPAPSMAWSPSEGAYESAAPRMAAAPHAAAPRVAAPATAPDPAAAAGPSTAEGQAVSSEFELPAGATREEGDAYSTVSVFYATDRAASSVPLSSYQLSGARQAVTLLGGAAICFGVFALLAMLMRYRSVGTASAVAACVTAGLAGICVLAGRANIEKHGVAYTSDRGPLVQGICNVTVPDSHTPGQVEAPTLLRLEIREDQDKHIVLTSAVELSQDEFRRRLAETVDEAPERDLLVFIHGYNVDFVSAVRRTAQIAVDLPFRGVPVCYSWPSQASLLGYTVDENNAAWTVSHLKAFLLDLAETSGADSINLVAHSMGNRALTSALSEISLELRDTPPLFDRVVLAAPDVDADHFRRDLAPRLLQTADSVTLYASSDDRALIASKKVHGYPRAGESGSELVVVPGIETIDVSGIDLSLLGHSYYGDSGKILRDLFGLVHHRLPAAQRQWLRPQQWGQLVYYQLLTDPPKTARLPQ